MPAGFQAWDAAGHLIVDFTSRLARIVGTRYINGQAGSFYDANLTAGDAFIAFQPEQVFGYIDNDVSRPIFSISGGTIAWTYSPANGAHNFKQQGYIFYGVR